jgi:hypothetical protein
MAWMGILGEPGFLRKELHVRPEYGQYNKGMCMLGVDVTGGSGQAHNRHHRYYNEK